LFECVSKKEGLKGVSNGPCRSMSKSLFPNAITSKITKQYKRPNFNIVCEAEGMIMVAAAAVVVLSG